MPEHRANSITRSRQQARRGGPDRDPHRDPDALRRLLDLEPGSSMSRWAEVPARRGRPPRRVRIVAPPRARVDRACVELLIERGSDLDGPAQPRGCFDRVELVELLLAAGAGWDGKSTASRRSSRDLPRLARVGRPAGRDRTRPRRAMGPAGTGPSTGSSVSSTGGGLTADAYLHPAEPRGHRVAAPAAARDVAKDVLDEALVHAAQNSGRPPSPGCWNMTPTQTPVPARLRRAAPGRGLRTPGASTPPRRRRRHRPDQRPQRRQRPRVGRIRPRPRAPRRPRRRRGPRPPPQPRLAPSRLGRLLIRNWVRPARGVKVAPWSLYGGRLREEDLTSNSPRPQEGRDRP